MMIRRPAVTLMEVLITMFIMAIGMLALLVLFPVGAVSMAQALKDDRCASAASMAEHCAIAMNLRQDPTVIGPNNNYIFNQITGVTLPQFPVGPSFPIYVDPYGWSVGSTTLTAGSRTSGLVAAFTPASIQRTSVSYVQANPNLVDRWFSLPNDITFLSNGLADTSSGSVDRGRQYSWAYLVQRPQAWFSEAVNVTVVVYRQRPVGVANPEVTYPVPVGIQGTSGLTLTWAATGPKLKRGTWLLDTSPLLNGVPAAKFYRITNVTETLPGQATVDVQPDLANPVTQVVVMDYVAEVFNKGISWKP